MEELQIELVDNTLTAEEFIRLKVATGFMDRPLKQVERALENGLFNVSAIYEGKVIGMGRKIVNRLIDHIKSASMPGTGVEVGLTDVKGKEPFYEKLGFSLGAFGMKRWIDIDV